MVEHLASCCRCSTIQDWICVTTLFILTIEAKANKNKSMLFPVTNVSCSRFEVKGDERRNTSGYTETRSSELDLVFSPSGNKVNLFIISFFFNYDKSIHSPISIAKAIKQNDEEFCRKKIEVRVLD